MGPEEKKIVIVLEMGEWDSYNLSGMSFNVDETKVIEILFN